MMDALCDDRTGHAVKNRFHQLTNQDKRGGQRCVPSPCGVATSAPKVWTTQVRPKLLLLLLMMMMMMTFHRERWGRPLTSCPPFAPSQPSAALYTYDNMKSQVRPHAMRADGS
jgi:hypothetical protein